MKLRIGGIIAIVLGCAVTVTTFAAQAGGAIAVGNCDRHGWSRNYATEGQARRRALAECRANGDYSCKVVVTVGHGSCGAFAISGNCGARGWSYAGSRSRAAQIALNACREYGGTHCRVRIAFCDQY